MKIPVLMYHEINSEDKFGSIFRFIQKKYVIETSSFKKQLSFLYSKGYNSLAVSELNQMTNDNSGNFIVLTFDDGYLGNYENAFFLLKKMNYKATFFVTTSLVGKPGMLNWSQIKEMSEAGMEIGSHTCSHTLLGVEKVENVKKELTQSKDIIERYIGKQVISVSYPNGSYSCLVNKIANESGYKFACSSEVGYWDSKKPKFVISRMGVPNNLDDFCKIIALNPIFLFSAFFQENLKKSLRIILGRKLYNRAYLKFFGLEELK